MQQYKSGDHLLTLQSVTEKILQFSDEDDLDHAAINNDGIISVMISKKIMTQAIMMGKISLYLPAWTHTLTLI